MSGCRIAGDTPTIVGLDPGRDVVERQVQCHAGPQIEPRRAALHPAPCSASERNSAEVETRHFAIDDQRPVGEGRGEVARDVTGLRIATRGQPVTQFEPFQSAREESRRSNGRPLPRSFGHPKLGMQFHGQFAEGPDRPTRRQFGFPTFDQRAARAEIG